MTTDAATTTSFDHDLEALRPELVGYCYRMLASPFEAEDAAQETMLRAWRASGSFERRASLRTWLYSIATNVCIDMADRHERRAMPMDLGPAREPIVENLATPEIPWVEPIPDAEITAIRRETVRLAFVTAIQRLPAKQRAVLVLRDVLHFSAAECAELLETSEPSVNSALQRARTTLDESSTELDRVSARATGADPELLDRFVEAFEAYDVERLERLLRDDVIQSMPPFDLWLAGRDDVLAWWFGPGIGCRGSRMVEAPSTYAGERVWGQYKPSETTPGTFEPWALVAVEAAPDGIAGFTFFLQPERLFERFGLPPNLPE